MSSLNIEYKGKKIPIAGIDIKSSNENVTFGSLERDLILKTLGKIYVQVGNKYYDLNFNLNGNNLSLNNVVAVKGMDKVNAKDYSNGTFLLETESSTLFLVYNNKLIELASGSGGSKLYLSYAEEQNLSGSQTHTLVYNAKLNIKSLDEISKFTYDDVYENQVIYVEDQKCHYVLDKYNVPNALTSWRPIYLTTMGGTLYDGLTIYNQSKNYTLALEGLHLEGDNIYKGLRIGTDENYIRTAATTDGIIKTEFNGTALVINRNNNTIFEYNNGNIGIGGKASRGEYNNILYGTSKLTGNLFTNYNIMSDDFQSRNITSWDGGQGYALKKTSIGTWFLEVDDLVVRNSISAEVLNLKELVVDRTYATGGHMMVTDGAKVSKVEYYPNITQENKDQVKHPLKETPINGTLDIGESYYFVYFNDQDKDVDEETGESEYDAGAFCPFIKGDILLCQSFTGLKTKKYYAIVSYSDNYRVAIKYKDFYGSYIIIDADRPSTNFDSLNSIDVKDELVRVGNEDPKRISRQKIIDIDGTRNWITMYDNLNSLKYAKDDNGDFVYDEEGRKIATDGPLTYDNLKLRIGNLAGLPDHGKGGTAVLPDDVGYGLFADNVYLKGKMVLWRVEDGVEYSEYLGINRGIWNPTAKYYVGDRVTYNGSYYYCAKVSDTGSNVGMNPEDYTDFWTLLVAKGSDGIPGQSVTYMNITGLSYFKVNTQDNPDPISITLTANLYNVDIDSLLKTIRYQWICNSTIVKDITYSDAFDTHLTSTLDIPYRGTTTNPVGDVQKEINWTTIWANANYNTFICNVFINGTQITVDQFTIYKIKDGADGAPGESGKPGLTIIASNEALVIPSDYNGYINPNFIGANSQSSCSIDVFSGATKLVYSETETGPDKYKISISSTTPNLISTFFEKANNTFYLIKGHYNSASSTNPKLPDSFIVNVSVITNGVTYTKKVSYGLAKAGQDANLLDWIKEWTGNTTEIQSDGIITPKIYVGDPLTKTDNKYILKNGIYLGRGLNSGDPAQFVGYGGGFRTFELDTKGRFFLGKQVTGATATSIPVYQDGGLSFDGNKLIIGNDSTIGGAGYTMGSLVNVVNEHKESISNIVGDSYVTSSEKFKLREIAARISQEYKDVETSLAGLLGITDVSTLPTNSVPFREYKTAYSKFLEDLNYYINANPDSDGFIPVVSGHNLNTSNNNYYNKLVTVRQEIENQRINRFNKNTANVLRQQTEPLTRGDGSPLQIGDIWISIDASGVDVFSKVVISTNPVVWRFLGDNTGTAIDKGLITTGTIKLTSKTNNQIDKAGITGSNSTIAYFNPSDLSDISITQNSTHSLGSAVRFWAGLTSTNQTWNDAPFKVYENGAVFATAGKIGALGINGDNMHVGGSSPFNNIITTRPEPSLLRTNPGLTIKSNGDIVGQDYYLSGDASKRASVFIGDFYFVEQPSNSIYNQFTSVSAGLNALNQKFDSMFSLAFVNIHNGNIIDGSLPEGANPSDYMLQIKAKMSFFSVGGITAKGASASSGNFWKGLPIDPNTLAWDSNDRLTVVGGTGGGGDISLNGTLYKPVNGVITLPNLATPGDITTALSGYATQTWVTDKNYATQSWVNGKGYVTATALATMGLATQAWVNSQGFLKSNSLDNYVTLNTIQNITAAKTFQGGIVSTTFRKSDGTASQFLKADGSVDGNLYALAYNNNPNKVLESNVSNALNVIDRRDITMTPMSFSGRAIETFFTNKSMPSGTWWSGISVNGWDKTKYVTWQLAGPASINNPTANLRFRTGIGSSWNEWKMILDKDYADGLYVKKTGDTMTGPLIIDVPVIPANPSINSPTKIGFKENGAQEVAFAYTDYDNYRAPAGIKLVSTENEPWFEAPWILGRKLNMSRVATEYSAVTGAVINYFGTDTIMNNHGSSITGTLKIRLPVTWTNTMGVYKIMLYEYNGRGSSEITVSFYNYSSSQSYYNYSYQLNGAFEGAVRIAHDGSGCCILLGDTAYTWNYPKIYMYQVFGGQNVPSNYVDQPFDLSIITSEAGLSRVTSVPKTSMNRHDANYIRALNKNGYYGMAIVGNSDNVYIRAPRLGIIPYSSGNPGEGMLGTEGWQFSHVYANQIKTQRVSSVTHNLYVGSSGNSGWVYCQDICSANGAAEAYWSIRTNGAAVFTNLTSKNKITGDINGNADGYATYLPTRYNGGTQANPQTYFNQHMGLRVAMTGIGWGGPWGDTLWINGYSGGDVLPMCTLHFIRNGTPRFGISTQNSNGTSYGTNYEVWTAYNSNKDGVNWSAQTFFSSIGLKSRNICIETDNSGNDGRCSSEINNWNSRLYLQHKSSQHLQMCNGGGNVAIGGISPDYKLNVSGDIRASSWIRTDGATGWYSQTYGGGIYCTDSDSVCIYNNKVLYNSGFRQWGIGGHYCGLKLYNANHIGINLANAKYTWGIYSNNNGNMYIGRRDGDVNNTTGGYVITLGYSTLSMNGNILASGGITAKTSSDIRLKNILNRKNYKNLILDLGLVETYSYNELAKNRKESHSPEGWHIGLMYHKVKPFMPQITGECSDGYGYINYHDSDLQGLVIGALQLSILDIKDLYNKHKTVYEKLEDALKRIEQLEKRLGNQP